MKFLKSQNTSRYSPSDNTFQVNPYGRAVMDFNGAVMIPKGTGDPAYNPGTAQNQRPDITGVRHPSDANGYMRFNTTTNSFEGYINGRWEVIRAPAASAISIETFGPGDAVDTIFGALTNIPASANNIIVLVENVMQIPTTNFTLNQNPSSTGTGQEVDSGNFVTSTEYIITATGSTNLSVNTVQRITIQERYLQQQVQEHRMLQDLLDQLAGILHLHLQFQHLKTLRYSLDLPTRR